MKILKISILLMISYLFLFSSCKEENKELTGKFTFLKGQVYLNDAKSKMGATIKSNDTITVKGKSSAVIQFSDSALITLKSNTVLKVNNLLRTKTGKPIVDLLQVKGTSFNKIVPGKAKYSLRTPTVVAGVRGTSFKLTITKSKKVQIQLLRGKVAIAPVGKAAEKSESTILEANQKISASENGITKSVKLSKIERKELSTLNEIKVLPKEKLSKVNTKSNEKQNEEVVPAKVSKAVYKMLEDEAATEKVITKELKKAGINIKEEVTKDKVKKKKEKLTLSELRKKYGKISRVTTKDGRTYVGVFKQAGKKMSVRTVTKKVYIKVNNIGKVEPVQVK